jgi:hypothetical protein
MIDQYHRGLGSFFKMTFKKYECSFKNQCWSDEIQSISSFQVMKIKILCSTSKP